MSAADLKSPVRLKPLMAALRRLALFPHKTVAIVSTETCTELSDLHAFIRAHGRPTRSSIEDLEDIIVGDKVETTRVERISAPPATPAPARRDFVETTTPKAAVVKAKPTSLADRCNEVLRVLVANQTMSEGDACERVGVYQSTFSSFKKLHFVPGPVDRARATKHLQSLATKPVKVEPKAAALPITPAETAQKPKAVSCRACSGATVKVRGRYPQDPPRDVCPTCLAEQMDTIADIVNRQDRAIATAVGAPRS